MAASDIEAYTKNCEYNGDEYFFIIYNTRPDPYNVYSFIDTKTGNNGHQYINQPQGEIYSF